MSNKNDNEFKKFLNGLALVLTYETLTTPFRRKRRYLFNNFLFALTSTTIDYIKLKEEENMNTKKQKETNMKNEEKKPQNETNYLNSRLIMFSADDMIDFAKWFGGDDVDEERLKDYIEHKRIQKEQEYDLYLKLKQKFEPPISCGNVRIIP